MVPLAHLHGAGQQGDAAVGLEMDAAHLVVRNSGDFQELTDAAPAQPLAALALRPPRSKAVPVGKRHRLLKHRREIPAVVDDAARRRIGQLRGLDVISPAELHRIDPHLGSRRVDDALDIVIGLRPPVAAIGADRHGVGEDALHVDLDRRRSIDTDRVLRRINRRRDDPALRDVGAEITEAGQAKRKEVPFGIERKLGRHLVRAAVRIRREARRARLRPFDRTAERLRREEDAEILREGMRLQPERAADMTRQHADGRARHVHHVCDLVARTDDALRFAVECVVARLRIEDAKRRARLHRVDDDAAVHDF